MGHGKETPRQKMIGMMYLVLLALLAMNVSAEILNAFVLVDNSLGKSEMSSLEKNNAVLGQFVAAYELNPKAVEEWKKKADETHIAANELIEEINKLQIEIVAAGDGTSELYENGDAENPKGSVNISKKDSKEEGTRILIEEGKGKELKAKVIALREKLVGMLNPEKDVAIAKSINEILNTEDGKGNEGGLVAWEISNFSEMPLVATITMLTKLKADVRNAEGDMLKFLKTKIGENDVKFNKIEAIVNAETAYVLQGEKYEAQVFIAASDSTVTPEIIVDGSKIEVVGGKGIYKGNTGSPGIKKWKGMINMLNPSTGDTLHYPFESEYQVAVPSVSVSPTQMNVFYIGVDNPVDVTAAGVAASDLSVSISGGTITKSGNGYVVRVKQVGKVKVNVTANGKSLGSKEFRCKIVPDPIATIGQDKQNWRGGVMNKSQLPGMRINATMENFDFNLTFNIVSHTVSATIKGFDESAAGTGNTFNGKQKQIIAQVDKNKRVIIDDIKAKGPDGTVRNLGSLVYKLK